MDCGPACLRMAAKHYKKSISLQSLREQAGIGKEGVNLLGISEAAEAIGFRSKAVRLELEALAKDAPLPVILHWNQNHFVVLYKAKRGKFYVADPAKGLIKYAAAEFKQHWISNKVDGVEEGIALLLEPGPNFYSEEYSSADQERGLHFKNIFNYIRPYKGLVGQLFLGLAVASLIQLFLPFLTQSIVDTGINTQNIHFVYVVLAAQIALFAGRIAVEFVRSWILLHISTRINISILTDFLIKLMRLPVPFFESKQTGDILQRMNDHSRIESFLTGTSLNTVFSLFNLIIFSIVLAVFNANLFIVFAVASVLYAFWVLLFMRKRKVLDYKRFEVASKEQSATIQLVQGMQEIKLAGVERSMRWGWEGLQARLFKLSMKGLSLNQWQTAGAFFINEGKNILITFLSAKAVIEGDMTLGAMLAVQYIVGQLNSPIEQMIQFAQSWQAAKISMDRLNEIHSLDDEEPAAKNLQRELPFAFARKISGGAATPLVVEKESTSTHWPHGMGANLASNTEGQQHFRFLQSGFSFKAADHLNAQPFQPDTHAPAITKEAVGIQFNGVTFTYPGAGNEPVLHNINLSIPKGKTTAIVGVSGSGKTTLLKLLLKFYEPQKGDIRLNSLPAGEGRGGASLSSISHKVWRSHCGVVMQVSFIFSNTIAHNIAIGDGNIHRERLQQAIDIANIRPFIESLPLGLNTKIGAEGTGISAGQKQRLLIARAVYRDPDFIFFDEATNSLDAQNESVIINNLNQFFQHRTVVVVAHRLSTVKSADNIVVVHQGTIAEQGTHAELVKAKGDYYNLVQNQLELGN